MAGFMDWEFAEVMLQGYPGGRYCEDVPSDNIPQSPAPDESPEQEAPRVLRFAYVAGVTPGKWIRRWEERVLDVPLESFMADDGAQVEVLRNGSAELSFARLPVEREGLNVIPLYEEQPVVVAPKGHEISVFEEVALADLGEETFLDVAEMGGPEAALQVVASGAGLVILPMSVARHFNVKDTVARRLTGAPGTEIALVWPADSTDEVIEEFIGIVRGRTAQSSRQPSAQPAKVKKDPKPDRRGTGAKKAPKVAQRYAPNPDKGRGKGSRKKGKR
ncbi:LysR family transcriptional regulator substrate-binding protein [Arthrobacter sp. AB6]|uniref:LysR family transcriptional regulator substrate-binding protein n=1 Tax=Arthrobacter sp. AB6 TaxID=2962570 RepID=UPI0028814554|nr:LysR family transcriptional regulator substrate-binding protein [Arthrobacter sp. AB6]MDT0197355.1 LysR family transcriptional regulator substrate-binding protein [Arthrobacter sp. AB6]